MVSVVSKTASHTVVTFILVNREFSLLNVFFQSRVKSGKFGHQVKSDSDIVCFVF